MPTLQAGMPAPHVLRFALGFLLLYAAAAAPQYVISTYAGGSPPATPTVGVDMPIGYPRGVAADAAGNVYFTSFNCVFKLDRNGVVTRIAGNSRQGYSGDGGPATSAQLEYSTSLAVDRAGNLFIAEWGAYRVRRISPDGIITTVAGNGTEGYSGDRGPATRAQVDPLAVAVDGAGNLFIAEPSTDRIRKVTPAGIITTVAGNGAVCSGGSYWGDGAPATSATCVVGAMTVDGAGNLFTASGINHIRKISPGGIITTVAGTGGALGTVGYSGDGGPATEALLNFGGGGPASTVAADGAGNVYVADTNNDAVRILRPVNSPF